MKDESLLFPAYARLKIQQNSWLYAPSNNYGSNFGVVKKRTSTTSSLLEQIATKALQPLVDEKRASLIEATAIISQSRNIAELSISINDINGGIINFDFNSVG